MTDLLNVVAMEPRSATITRLLSPATQLRWQKGARFEEDDLAALLAIDDKLPEVVSHHLKEQAQVIAGDSDDVQKWAFTFFLTTLGYRFGRMLLRADADESWPIEDFDIENAQALARTVNSFDEYSLWGDTATAAPDEVLAFLLQIAETAGVDHGQVGIGKFEAEQLRPFNAGYATALFELDNLSGKFRYLPG